MAINADRGVKSREHDYTTSITYYYSLSVSQEEINIRDVEGVPQSNDLMNSTYLRSIRKCM